MYSNIFIKKPETLSQESRIMGEESQQKIKYRFELK